MGAFQPLAQRASELLADRPSLDVFAWPDQVIDTLGHDPHDPYCEQSWLPIVGPSVYLLGRRFVMWLDANPDGLTVPLVPLSAAVGLGQGTGRNAPAHPLVGPHGGIRPGPVDPGDRLAVRRRWPPLTAARARRLPGWLAQDHDAAVRAEADAARAARLYAVG